MTTSHRRTLTAHSLLVVAMRRYWIQTISRFLTLQLGQYRRRSLPLKGIGEHSYSRNSDSPLCRLRLSVAARANSASSQVIQSFQQVSSISELSLVMTGKSVPR